MCFITALEEQPVQLPFEIHAACKLRGPGNSFLPLDSWLNLPAEPGSKGKQSEVALVLNSVLSLYTDTWHSFYDKDPCRNNLPLGRALMAC